MRGLYIEVGQPGVTHDAVLMAQETGSLTLRTATTPSQAPTVVDVIDAITAQLKHDIEHARQVLGLS